jgi:hypothetical protein
MADIDDATFSAAFMLIFASFRLTLSALLIFAITPLARRQLIFY